MTISATGDKAPLFIVHGAGGNVLFLWSLARAMAGDRPIYGFQAHGVDGHDMPDATIEEMATRYVAELRAAHRGPYLLGGYSGGGIVTFEMVRQLQALGEEVKYVVLLRQRAARPGHPVAVATRPATCGPTCVVTGSRGCVRSSRSGPRPRPSGSCRRAAAARCTSRPTSVSSACATSSRSGSSTCSSTSAPPPTST